MSEWVVAMSSFFFLWVAYGSCFYSWHTYYQNTFSVTGIRLHTEKIHTYSFEGSNRHDVDEQCSSISFASECWAGDTTKQLLTDVSAERLLITITITVTSKLSLIVHWDSHNLSLRFTRFLTSVFLWIHWKLFISFCDDVSSCNLPWGCRDKKIH